MIWAILVYDQLCTYHCFPMEGVWWEYLGVRHSSHTKRRRGAMGAWAGAGEVIRHLKGKF